MSFMLKEFREATKLLDMSDKETYITVGVVNEAEQKEILLGITNRLYAKIEAKVGDIDFGTIPQSKGIFEDIDGVDIVQDALKDIEDLYKEYRQPLTYVNTIKKAIENIISLKGEFNRSFVTNTSFGIIMYEVTAMSIISSVSLLISSTIDFIVDPRSKSIEVSVDKVAVRQSKDFLQFKCLEEFNKLCNGNKLRNALNEMIKANAKNFTGVSVLTIIGISITLIFTLVPIMRELIYYFYYCRASVAEYFETQMTMLTLNATRLESAGDLETAKKQRAAVEKFRRIANFLEVDAKEATHKTEKDVDADNKEKYKIDDVTESLPDSAASSLF